MKYFILVLLLVACKGDPEQASEEELPLYPEPITVALNSSEGYIINLLTGDSIKPLLNSFGDTIKTGISVAFSPKKNSDEATIKSTIIEAVPVVKTIIPGNVHPVPAKLSVIIVDTTRLKKVKLGEGDQSFVLRNTYGIVRTGVPIPVTGKKMPFSEPHPVRAAPMRFKDNATTSIQYLDVDQGLNFSYVYGVCEDKKGNLWFGMDEVGVNKYDGVNITNYTEKEGLSNNVVLSVFEDRNNNLWFGTQHGATCFDGKNFIQYTEKEGLANNEVSSISEDKKGNLWFCTMGGVAKYNGKDFTYYTRREGLPGDTVYNCIEDRSGNIWLATSQGTVKFDGFFFTYYTQKDGLAGETISTLLEDKEGNMWFGTGNSISKFDGEHFIHFKKEDGLSSNLILSMILDRNGNIWIGTTGGGINRFDGKSFTHYNMEQGLSNNKIRKIIEDKSGNIWFGTDGGGVNKINAASFDYKVPEEVMDNNKIRPILKDKNGNLWLGTEGGHVGKLGAEQKQGGGRLFTYYKVQDKLFNKGQRSLLQDKKGNIWIGTTGSGIIKYDGKNFTNYSLGVSQERQIIFDILEDKNGSIWFGQRDGSIVRYDGENFILYATKEGLPGSIIYSMLEDKKGNIWFCTEGAGIYKYDGTNLVIYSEKEGLFNKSITSITEDSEGNIWLGTLGAGVCRFDGSSFTYYSDQQGLSNNNVWSVFCDSAKQLWFGTDKGLVLFIPQKDSLKDKYTVYNFGSQDGLKAIDFNLHSVCVDNDNRIWWGTGKSVPSFDLNKEIRRDSLRSLSINYIEINERFYDFRNPGDSSKSKTTFSSVVPFHNYPEDLSLSYDQNHLTFHFSAIDWAAPEKIKYRYRLIGLDQNWSSPSSDPIAGYRGLRHGKYELQVKAIGQSQLWTEPIRYRFTILPPWWLTWWFKSIIIFVSLALLFFVVRFIYMVQLRKQKTLLEKKLAVQYERQRISAEMHDDIGAGLSGIKLMTEMAKKKSKDGESISEMEKIYQSVGDVSSKMKEVIWSLNTENDSLANLVSYLQRQARLMMENYPGDFNMTMPDKMPDVKISGEVRRHIYLAVKEALHNIIKHSGADKVQVTITCDNKIRIIVSDNGKGMSMDQNDNTGNGLKNMRVRMQQAGGDFFIKNAEGLTLTFEIPLKPDL
jgi:ligand-binding sensor domain-containing protein/signal transduction histidine kinase